MPIDFPSSPTLNQVVTVNNKEYIWDGVKWVGKILNGPAGTVALATLNDDTATNASVYPVWVAAGTNQPLKVSTTKLLFNPSLGTLTLGGDLQINGGDILDSNGNESIRLTATASAVNEITVVNAATGNSPSISATGGNTDININLTPKGAGVVVVSTDLRLNGNDILDSNGNESIRLSATASAVNEITVTNAAASGDPALSATGTDTDIDLLLIPKGTGEIAIGTGAAAATLTSRGAHNLRLDTNFGSSSSSIEITDAANGNITLTPNGTGVLVVGASAPSTTSGSIAYSSNKFHYGNGTQTLLMTPITEEYSGTSWSRVSPGATLSDIANTTFLVVSEADTATVYVHVAIANNSTVGYSGVVSGQNSSFTSPGPVIIRWVGQTSYSPPNYIYTYYINGTERTISDPNNNNLSIWVSGSTAQAQTPEQHTVFRLR
jgi:hypothetical protein